MRRPYLNVVLIVTAAAAAACSDDPTGSGSEVTEAEARAMAGALFALTQSTSFDAAAGAPEASPGGEAAPITLDTRVAFDAPCPLGGKLGVDASLKGSFDVATGVADLAFDVVERHDGCVAKDPETGMQFTFDGDPSLSVGFDLDAKSNGDFTLVGDYSGRVDWETAEKSGTCEIDVAFNASGNSKNETGTVTVDGSICGVVVEATISST